MAKGALRLRPAFTLIELLVVIALIMVLAGLTAGFLPAIGNSARAARGGSMLQQWLLEAKQKALRDQVPCGLRLLPGATTAAQVDTCQFIEQPDDFPLTVGSTLSTTGAGPPFTQVKISVALGDQINPNPANPSLTTDYLEVLGSGLMHKIVGNASGTPTTLRLSTGIPYSIPAANPTKQYRIVRAPRPVGDDLLQLPDLVIIDLATNAANSNPLPTANSDGSHDILFAPSGEVISPGTTTDSINLWVRDTSAASASSTDGDQTIVAVYVRSGATAAHPPAPGADPYAFIKDGRSSGK